MKPSPRYYSQIQAWIDSFFFGKNISFSYQYRAGNGVVIYNPFQGSLTQEMVTEHFYSPIVQTGNRVRGTIAVVPTFQGKFLKWICFDLDNAEAVTKAQPLLDKLRELNIDYLLEYGGANLERRHVWIRVESDQSLAQQFFTTLLMHTYNYLDRFAPFGKGEFEEVFGINKPSNLIRMPLGLHLKYEKHGKRYPIEMPSGALSDNPEDFIEEWLKMTPLTEERMSELYLTFQVAPLPGKKRETTSRNKEYDQLIYFPRNLAAPVEDIPKMLQPIVRNCQAINGVLDDIANDKMIEMPGDVHHLAGLYVSGLAAYNDGAIKKKTGRMGTEGKKWFDGLRAKYRMREDVSHNWGSSRQKAEHNPDRIFASCEAWEKKFNKCDGCPFKNKVTTPKQFIWGQPITRKLLSSVNLTTTAKIRQTTFPAFKQRIKGAVKNKEIVDLLLASPMGSGKSFLVDDISCDLVKAGRNVLIAVPTTTLALEHKERLDKCGAHSFVLASHKSIFTNGLSPFPCPSFDDIQDKIKLGVSTKTIKQTHCAGCVHYDDCYYPTQYTKVMEPQHQIVIIQHAHFSVPEVIYDLMKKSFDVLFIDESFVKQCYTSIPINQFEVQILNTVQEKWTIKLVDWLEGKSKPTGSLDPSAGDLLLVKKIFDASSLPWRIPDLIRFYNQGKEVNPFMGLEVIYELPPVGVRVFTDATPPENLIKSLTGAEQLEVWGKGEILDHRQIHPDNKVYQVLDNSTSVSSLKDPQKFEDLMMKIAELVELQYTTHQVLLTVYKADFERVEDFFKLHQMEFPTARSRITVDRMDKGTNKYEDYDVQFLLAGVYYTGKQTLIDAYKYKSVANYYNKKNGKDYMQNLFPIVDGLGSIGQERVPVQRVEPLRGGGGAVVEYPIVTTNYPTDVWHTYVWDFNIANTQQAIRLRFKPDKPRTVYILNNLFFPSLLVTDSITYEEFIQPL